MDKIVIKELQLRACVGVTAAERARPQRLVVTLELELDLAKAGRTDDVAAATRYDVVADLARQEAARKPRKLIEAVAEGIAGAILARKLAKRVSVEVRKFSVPKTRWVAVEIWRT